MAIVADRALGGGDVERHFAAEETVGAETAEHQIGVGDGRLVAAEPVAGRPGRRARALRPDAQAAVIDARDRAAAGADLENIHHGDLHRQRLVVAADQRLRGGQRLALVDDAGLRGGAAHVEGDGVVDAERMAERLRADDAGGRARFEHADALVLRLRRVVEPAGRLHDQERAVEALAAHMLVDLADIAAHLRPDIGVGDHRRAALELAILLAELVRGRDEHPGMVLLQDRLGARLVRRAGVAVDEQDRGSFDAALVEFRAERRDLRFVERLLDLAVGKHALLDLEAQRALDQRRVLLEEQIIGVRAVDAPDLVDVAKAFGDQQRGFRAGALEDRVDRHRRAMQEQAGRAIVAAGLLDPAVDAVDQPLWRRQRLAEGQRAGLVVEHRNVGEGAADIGGEAHLGLRPRARLGTRLRFRHPVDPCFFLCRREAYLAIPRQGFTPSERSATCAAAHSILLRGQALTACR